MLYLIQFLDEWTDFRYAEFLALFVQEGDLDLEDIAVVVAAEVSQLWNVTAANPDQPRLAAYIDFLRENELALQFLIVDFHNEEVLIRVAQKMVLVKAIYELWAHDALSFGGLLEKIRNLDANFTNPFLESDRTWSIDVNPFAKSLSMEQKQFYRMFFSFLQFQGPVQIKNPSIDMWLVMDCSKCPAKVDLPADPQIPCYFGRRIAVSGMKDATKKYSLKTRLYLGPTSLDASLALILCNLTGVQPGMIAYEPFIGTGSIAVALTHCGAFCLGSDIDPRMMRGDVYAGKEYDKNTEDKRDVFSNFRAYQLPLPELIRMDIHNFGRHCNISSDGLFDVIVTDPPYGIRAGARKSGRKKCDYIIPPERRDDHIPSTQNYPVEEVMLDLLRIAAETLKVQGKLLYLIPTTYDFVLEDLPCHPCLELTEVCHQHLSTRHGRRAVIMQKTRHCSAEDRAEYDLYCHRVINGEVGTLINIVFFMV